MAHQGSHQGAPTHISVHRHPVEHQTRRCFPPRWTITYSQHHQTEQNRTKITDLPVELLQNIIRRLTITKDILSFAATCTTAASVYRDTWEPTIHTLCQRHWNNTAPVAPPTANPALVHSPQLLLDWRQQAEDNLRGCTPVREWDSQYFQDFDRAEFVRINRLHRRVVSASPHARNDDDDDDEEEEEEEEEDDNDDNSICVSIWDINGRKIHSLDLRMAWNDCAIDTAFDVLTLVDHEARFCVMDLNTCEVVWQSDATRLQRMPYASTQILNNELFLTSHPFTNHIVLHDSRMPPHSSALCFKPPEGIITAYAMHQGTRATPVPTAQDVSCIAAYCVPQPSSGENVICTYDIRMVGERPPQLIDKCCVQGGGIEVFITSKTIDNNGRFLTMSLTHRTQPSTYSLQVWDLLRPLEHGPLASATADEEQCGRMLRMTDDARNVVTGGDGGYACIWAPGAGEAARGEQVVLQCMGKYQPQSLYVDTLDVADTLLVCGGQGEKLAFASFSE